MKRRELERLLALHKNDARPVVLRLAAAERPLEGDARDFALAHLRALSAPELLAVLERCPEGAVVEALLRAVPRESTTLAWHLRKAAPRLEPECFAELALRLRGKLAEPDWRSLLPFVRGCALFETAAQLGDPLAVPWLESRHDALACRASLRALLAGPERPRALRLLAHASLTRGALGEPERASLREALAELPLAELARACAGLSDEGALREHLARRVEAPELFGPEVLPLLGPACVEPLRARAARTENPEELCALLEHLGTLGVPRRERLALAVSRWSDESPEPVYAATMAWVGAQLRTRSAWEESGVPVLEALLAAWYWDFAGRLLTLLEHASSSEEPGVYLLHRKPSWAPALHEALGRVLLSRCARALDEGHAAGVQGSLQALLHLRLSPRAVRSLLELRRHPKATEETRELLGLHVELLRREEPEESAALGSLVEVLAAMS